MCLVFGEMFMWLQKKFHNIPLWFINILTVVSGIVTIITPIITIISSFKSGFSPQKWIYITITLLALLNVIQFLRIRKYRYISTNQMEKTSDSYHHFLHEARNLYFDIMHSYKKKTLTTSGLSEIYKEHLRALLDQLCIIMNALTERKISACIKLISYGDDEEVIDADKAKLVTFCRSANSNTDRENYEKHGHEILMKDNTDFWEIVSKDSDKDYFYQGNLEKYAKEMQKLGKRYRNTNENWAEYYKGTIVVPIRIEFKKLYHLKKDDDEFHIIGFICVDSPSADAFTEKQETYNVDTVKAFADMIYILLGQYRHYLNKLAAQTNVVDK